MKNLNADSEDQTNNKNTIGPRMRVAVIIIFSIISLFLTVIVVDKIGTGLIISISENKISATITKVEITKRGSVRSYWIYYTFEVDGRNYERKSIFGIFNKATQISSSDVKSLTEGSRIDVLYSGMKPELNYSVYDPYRYDNIIFMIIGIFLFGFLAFNETKICLKIKKPG